MSLTCPRCGNSLEQDFGVITCGRCHTILFVDMEGQVQLANAEPSSANENPELATEADPGAGAADAGQSWSSGSDGYDSNPEAPPEFSSDADPAMPSWQPTEANPDSFSAQESESSESFAGEGASAEFMTRDTSQSMAEGLSEVSDFGNNEQDFGALSYTLLIENIDTGDIRNKLAEALTDSKFQWDVVELLQKIEKGRLEISQLNPVKASILVHRLQEVPVRVSWNQKLL
jgi:hypothetical protein